MRNTFTLLGALLFMTSLALAQPSRRAPSISSRDAGARADASVVAGDAGAARDAGGAGDSAVVRAPAAPTCCCRAWSHGWQYSWRSEGECGTQNGTCVSPDHC